MSKRRRHEDEDSGAGSEDEEEDIEEMVAAGIIKPSAAGAKTQHVNNVAGLKQALADIKQDLPWIERLEVVSAEPLDISDPNDDLKVELAFYGQALAAVVAARGELDRLKVPHRRPDDYFAEMLKSDDHMAKIKNKLLTEQKRMTAVEHRRHEKEAAVFNKKAATAKLQDKAKEKRSAEDSLKQWKKHKGDARPELDDVLEGRAGGDDGDRAAGRGGPNRKRQSKDRKFGFGGRKRFSKENDAKSSKNMKDFSVKRMKSNNGPGGKPSGGSGGGYKGGRPGGAPGGGAGGKHKGSKAGGARPGKWARSAGRK